MAHHGPTVFPRSAAQYHFIDGDKGGIGCQQVIGEAKIGNLLYPVILWMKRLIVTQGRDAVSGPEVAERRVCRQRLSGGKICATIKKTDGHIELMVRDNGPGIPTYAIGRAFERFYSLKRPDTGKKSSGLGLSVVKEVALLHNGAASVRNAPDGGVEARLVFPESAGGESK